MTREHAKELLPLLQAYAEGKIIQTIMPNGEWRDCDKPDFSYNLSFYRIKPEEEKCERCINSDKEIDCNKCDIQIKNKEYTHLKFIKCCPHGNEPLDMTTAFISNGILYCKHCNQELPMEVSEFQKMFEDDIDYSTSVNNTTNTDL